MMKLFLKKIYQGIPFKKPAFQLLKKIWHPPEKIYRHLHFRGKFRVKVEGSSSFLIRHYGFQVENEIFWAGLTGGWEKESIQLWIKLCADAQNIFDIGANTGVYSLIAKTVHPGASVFAFEPVQRVFERLEENKYLNRFDICCFEKALSDYDGAATIYDTASEHIYSVTVNKNLNKPEIQVKETRIQVMRLDTFIEMQKITSIDLMKIDVETHEAEVLQGMGKYLELFKPTLLIEILNEEVARKVEALVKGLDYVFFNINEQKGIRRTTLLSPIEGFNFLLCDSTLAKAF